MKTSLWFTVSSVVMGALFFLSVALQYNDPDPIQWMLLYGAAAFVSFRMPWKPAEKKPALAVFLVSLVWFLWLLPDVLGVLSFFDLFLKMSEVGGAVEVGREAGGLAIVVTWMLCCVLVRFNSRVG